MADYNKWISIGRLTRDVRVEFLQSGTPVGEFGFATSRKIKETKKTTFIDCRIYGKSAETLAKYVKKGDPLLVEGPLDMDQWEKEGQKRTKHFITIDSFTFLSGGQQRQEQQAAPAAENDIPF